MRPNEKWAASSPNLPPNASCHPRQPASRGSVRFHDKLVPRIQAHPRHLVEGVAMLYPCNATNHGERLPHGLHRRGSRYCLPAWRGNSGQVPELYSPVLRYSWRESNGRTCPAESNGLHDAKTRDLALGRNSGLPRRDSGDTIPPHQANPRWIKYAIS